MGSALSVCKSMCVEDSVENNPEAGAKSDVVNVESTTAGADSAKHVTGTSSHVESTSEEDEENSDTDEEDYEDFEGLREKILDETIDEAERFTYKSKQVKLCIRTLKEMDYGSFECRKYFEVLAGHTLIYPFEKRKMLCRTFLNRGFIDDLCTKLLQEVDNTKCYQIEDTLMASHQVLYISHAFLLGIMWNGSDTLDKFCQRLVNSGVMAKLTEMIGSPVFQRQLEMSDKWGEPNFVYENHEEQDETMQHMHYIIASVLSITHNVCRYVVLTGQLREKTVECVQNYTNTKNVCVKTLAVLVLAYTIDHDKDDNEKISASTESIEFLKALFEDSLSRPREHVKGFTISEILEGLNKLAVNNGNSETIVQLGFLPLYVKCLEKEEDEVVLQATKGLWTFSFCEENKKSILKEKGCVAALKRLKDRGKNKELSKAAEGALVNLGVVKLKRDAAGENKGHDVMISYQWDSWESVKWIYQELKSHGFKIWIDKESMGGSTLDSMAEGVENATVVILCITEKYKESQNCRMEAEHSLKHGKKFIPLKLEHDYPSLGWLGLILGTKFYYDFSEEEQREQKLEELCEALHKDVPCPEGVHQVDGPPEKTIPRKLITQEELQQSLCDLGLKKYSRKFKEFGGEQLVELLDVYRKSPSFYYKMMISKFNMEPLHLLNFNKFLKTLG